MKIESQAKQFLDEHYDGRLSTLEFLHRLNRLVTVRKEEPTVTYEIDDGKWIIQTMSPKVIPNVLNSDAEINAREYDDNGFMREVRAIVSTRELIEILDKAEKARSRKANGITHNKEEET
ncbi:hypothetical protein [Halobacillus seohaensis]|uniref:Uncharacterized protein n=1 Tax=Halobacillus seohaensis TaxID=447421 RepID=A0ABW2EN16_9BACI